MRLDVNKIKEAFVEIENKLKIVDIIDVPGVTWHHNRAMFLKLLAAHFNNSQHSRNYVSVCSRLFKAANSEDIKDCSAPNVIQMAILDSNCIVKTILKYLGCVKEIKRLAYLKCLVSVRAEHLHWLSETINDLKTRKETGKCIPSERKEEIEGIVNEIIEKPEPQLEKEVLEEIREDNEVDPEGHLKIKFARVYLRNPVRVLTYTNI